MQGRDDGAERLGRRCFSLDDQQWFARFSGDVNPMHMDTLAARRTQAGAPAVHGVHLLLWALDAMAAAKATDRPIASVQARFDKFCCIEEPAEAWLSSIDEKSAIILIKVGEIVLCTFQIVFGHPAGTRIHPPFSDKTSHAPAFARELSLSEIQGERGVMALALLPEDEVAFPSVVSWIGAARVRLIGGTSRLVGMVCPGLHSIYAKLKFDIVSPDGPDDTLTYSVDSVNELFRLVRMSFAGAGVAGRIETFIRRPPQQQARSAELSRAYRSDALRDVNALIVGGSRGLGELTAKLLVTQGAEITITYRVGADDAEDVASEIRQQAGVCRTMRYDVLTPAPPALADLERPITHIYYFATPQIFGRVGSGFDLERWKIFQGVYVDGFWHLCAMLHQRFPKVVAFYPSSTAVASRPVGMTEYAMAKAAGEILCEDIDRLLSPMRVVRARLPRLPTDQTASLVDTRSEDPVATMQAMISLVHGGAALSWLNADPAPM